MNFLGSKTVELVIVLFWTLWVSFTKELDSLSERSSKVEGREESRVSLILQENDGRHTDVREEGILFRVKCWISTVLLRVVVSFQKNYGIQDDNNDSNNRLWWSRAMDREFDKNTEDQPLVFSSNKQLGEESFRTLRNICRAFFEQCWWLMVLDCKPCRYGITKSICSLFI